MFIYFLGLYYLLAWAREGMNMDNKELTEEERAGLKKLANVLARFVLDVIEQEKKRANSNNNNHSNKERARAVATDLFGAFSWYDTEEGYNYWSDVYIKLRRIAEDGY